MIQVKIGAPAFYADRGIPGRISCRIQARGAPQPRLKQITAGSLIRTRIGRFSRIPRVPGNYLMPLGDVGSCDLIYLHGELVDGGQQLERFGFAIGAVAYDAIPHDHAAILCRREFFMVVFVCDRLQHRVTA